MIFRTLLASTLLALSWTAFAQDTTPIALPPLVELPVDADMASDPLPSDPVVSAPITDFEWLRRPTTESVVCPFRGRIDYEAGAIECGLIVVPENREVNDSRSIELHYVRILAKGKNKDGQAVAKRSDPVVYLTGGPGAGVEYYVKRLKDHGLVEQRDLYILEQRGIGSSSTFCPFFDTRNRAEQIHANFEDYQRVLFARARSCIDGARAQGVDLRGYHTFENARDVRALRQALGFTRWNVWGISYGSVLAQALIKVDPDGISAMVIDGIVPLDIGELMHLARWYTRDLEQLFAACATQPACAAAYPNQQTRYLAAIAAVLAEPFAFDVKPQERFPGGKAYVFADLVAGMPFSLMYEQSTHAAMPAIIEGLIKAVEERDMTFFKALALLDPAAMQSSGYGAGMALAIHCQDGYVDGQVAAAAEEHAKYPVLAAAFSSATVTAEMAGMCAQGGLPRRDLEQYAAVTSTLPIVVANGRWDPVTPTPLAEYIMPGLTNAQLVEFPHAGHGPTRSLECAGTFLNDFYNDPTAPLNLQCVKDGEQAAQYVAPYFASDALSRAALLWSEDKKSLYLHGLWGSVSVLCLLIGLFVLVLGGLARRWNRDPATRGVTARWMTGLAALSGVAYVAGVGTAAGLAAAITPALLLFGFLGWASGFAWLGPISGVLGLIALLLAFGGAGLKRSARLGCTLVAMAAISISVFGWYWDLWPF
jgi:pimeloyl-ACP methyl ester carboxylesterase